MKVILAKDFPPLGLAGEIREVASGYARNFLIPKKIAIPATEENLKEWEKRQKALQRKRLIEEERLKELSSKLEGITLKIRAKAGEGGKLYGSITSRRIVEELAKLSLNLDRKKIKLGGPIKEVGEYEVLVRLGGDSNPRFKLIVEPEEG